MHKCVLLIWPTAKQHSGTATFAYSNISYGMLPGLSSEPRVCTLSLVLLVPSFTYPYINIPNRIPKLVQCRELVCSLSGYLCGTDEKCSQPERFGNN